MLAFVVPANAQGITPSQLALRINSEVAQLAQALEQAQTQLGQSQARIKELEDKYEKKPEVKK